MTETPRVFIREIEFNDGTKLALDRNSIVIFTGANNCGKSQVLRDIEIALSSDNARKPLVIKKIEKECLGSIEETEFFHKHFFPQKDNIYSIADSGDYISMQEILNGWRDRAFSNMMHTLFVHRLKTEDRINMSDSLVRNESSVSHPLTKLFKNVALSNKISQYFRLAFGLALIVDRLDLTTIPLYVGNEPQKEQYTLDNQDDYYDLVRKLPRLQEQGDGMRSFASILIDAFTSDYSMTLIDEPEAFLHPPQARVMGKILVSQSHGDRQLFISTHSEDFIKGVLEENNDNVVIIRIDRKDIINKINVLDNHRIKNLWGNPIMRYSNALSGLFHEKVIVCESDYDCLFYQAIINSIYENRQELAPDILFLHCGGKDRVKDIVGALKALDVKIGAIVDFDVLDKEKSFKLLTGSFGIDWEKELASDMRKIYDSVNEKQSKGEEGWKAIKKKGKEGFDLAIISVYERVESKCKAKGLFVVPCGEIECFDRTINVEKKNWVYEVLDNYNLANEPKLAKARAFVEEVGNM